MEKNIAINVKEYKNYMEDLVSVIVPIYNVENYLCQCLDSIINQTYKNLEIILVDDGSPDNCGSICDRYASMDMRIRVIHKKNGGVSDARNAGMRAIAGEYVMFVDSDDWIALDYIEKIMLNTPFDIAMTGYTIADEDGDIIDDISIARCDDFKKNKKIFVDSVYRSFFGYSGGKVYRRSIVKEILFQDILLREDFVYNIAAMDNAEVVIAIDQSGYYYRQREKSTLHNRYSGDIPDLLRFPKLVINSFHIMSDEFVNTKLGNFVIKTYLIDCLKKYIYENESLTWKQKQKAIISVLQDVDIKDYLKLYKEETIFFTFFTFCMKNGLYRIAFFTMRRIFHE